MRVKKKYEEKALLGFFTVQKKSPHSFLLLLTHWGPKNSVFSLPFSFSFFIVLFSLSVCTWLYFLPLSLFHSFCKAETWGRRCLHTPNLFQQLCKFSFFFHFSFCLFDLTEFELVYNEIFQSTCGHREIERIEYPANIFNKKKSGFYLKKKMIF